MPQGERLFVYLSTSNFSVSAALVVEREQAQWPIYYISKVLHDAKTHYTLLEKITLALLMASHRLRYYIEAHPVTVLTAHPIKVVMGFSDLFGRIMKLATILAESDIEFRPRTAVKGKVLAELLINLPSVTPHSDCAGQSHGRKWNLYIDKSSTN